jgi:lysophospholipase L1-like esterase
MSHLRLLTLLLLGQALARYPGDRPGAVASSSEACSVARTTLALYGDSIGAGACNSTLPATKLEQLLGAGWVATLNTGDGSQPAVSGYTAAQIRARYEATHATACAGEPCGYVVVQGGVNSLKGGVSPEDTLEDMVAVVDHALAQSYRVAWLGVLPYAGCTAPLCTEEAAAEAHAKATAYNALVAAACAARPAVRCVLPYETFEDPAEEGHLREEYSCSGSDKLHLKQAGADVLYGAVATKVEELETLCL